MKCIDVIVPVYRGVDETRRCIESVLSSANKRPFELVVINDDSPELAIHDWLNSEIANKPNVTVLTNERNLGFVGTVNRGMSLHEDRDVVLLNSDTEVANDWLDRLHAWTERVPSVGTITPFSNNATICSYPRFCESNDIPQGWSVAEIDHACFSANAGKCVEVPTGVGFCMYISRACLDDIGLFDEATFGRGYGEENDFCMRAKEKGWKNLLAADVFVFHEGRVSFNEESLSLQEAALEKLLGKHPDYSRMVAAWVQRDPPADLRQRINIERLKMSCKPGLLFVAHGLGGGTYTHIDELVDIAGSRANVFILEPGNDSLILRWINKGEAFIAQYRLFEEWPLLLETLNRLAINRIHYHHVYGHVDDVLRLPKDMGLPYDITVHDYYFVCPQIHLNDLDGKYCGLPENDVCAYCLSRRPTPEKAGIVEWRNRSREFLAGAERIFCPSEDVISRLKTILNDLSYIYAPHPAAWQSLPKRVRGIEGGEGAIRVACLGALPAIKGSEVLEASAIDAQKKGMNIDFHLIGYAHRALKESPASKLTVHGKYNLAELRSIVDRIQPDIFWFPSQAPETFCFTLGEVLRMGYPVAVTNLGALPERVAGRPNSWVQEWQTTHEDWNRFFLELKSEGVPDTCWEAGKPDGFDYFGCYLPKTWPEQVKISIAFDSFPDVHSRAIRLSQRITQWTRKAIHNSVVLGKLFHRVPLVWRRKIKRILGVRH